MNAGLIVFDVDSTLTTTEGIDLLAELAGVGEQVAELTAQAMAGQLDFAASLRKRVAALAGLPALELDRANEQVQITPGALRLCAQLRQAGWRIGAVSGGFSAMVDPLVDLFGLDHVRANRLEVIDGKLTGRVLGNIVDAKAKAAALTEWAQQDGIAPEWTVAVGDGANDVLMLGQAGIGIGYRPKPVLREVADVVIEYGGLDQVLDVLGII